MYLHLTARCLCSVCCSWLLSCRENPQAEDEDEAVEEASSSSESESEEEGDKEEVLDKRAGEQLAGL